MLEKVLCLPPRQVGPRARDRQRRRFARQQLDLWELERDAELADLPVDLRKAEQPQAGEVG